MKVPAPSTVLVGLALAFLTIKDLQEVFGLRVISILLPVLLAALYADKIQRLAVPPPVLAYMIIGCVAFPLISFYAQGTVTIYTLYLIMTILCGYLLVAIPYYLMGKDVEWLANMYANTIVLICFLSYLTLQHQYYGGYAIRSFSDFRTFFALQASLAVPFLHGRYRNFWRIVVLITLFMANSRLSFFLAAAVMFFQFYKESKPKFLLLAPIFSAI